MQCEGTWLPPDLHECQRCDDGGHREDPNDTFLTDATGDNDPDAGDHGQQERRGVVVEQLELERNLEKKRECDRRTGERVECCTGRTSKPDTIGARNPRGRVDERECKP
jgi:hypothetical protein